MDGGGVLLEGGLASSNRAAQRGGVLFATGLSTVAWGAGGQSRNNSAASGGSLYLSSSAVNLTDLTLAGDLTPSGPNVFLAAADVRAVNVTAVAPADPAATATFALHADSGSRLRAYACGFDGWDAASSPCVVSEGSIVLDACDFRGSGTPTLVRASGRDGATVRNAVLGDKNHARAGFNASTPLGVGVRGCASLPEGLGCADPEECVDAENGMGVLCPAFEVAATGGEFALAGDGDDADAAATPVVDLSVVAPESPSGDEEEEEEAAVVFYYPELVTKELVLRQPAVSSLEDGAEVSGGEGGVLWELRRTDGGGGGGGGDGDAELGLAADENGTFAGVSADNFTWTAVPRSGQLVAGQEVTVKLVGTPPPPLDPTRPFAVYNGPVSAEFRVVSRTAAGADSSVASAPAAVGAMFYYCKDGSFWDGAGCVSCAEEMATMAGGEGALDCTMPGVTLDTLPLAEGERKSRPAPARTRKRDATRLVGRVRVLCLVAVCELAIHRPVR